MAYLQIIKRAISNLNVRIALFRVFNYLIFLALNWFLFLSLNLKNTRIRMPIVGTETIKIRAILWDKYDGFSSSGSGIAIVNLYVAELP